MFKVFEHEFVNDVPETADGPYFLDFKLINLQTSLFTECTQNLCRKHLLVTLAYVSIMATIMVVSVLLFSMISL